MELDRAKLQQNMRDRKFVENNGAVLRAVNILRERYVKLGDLKYALEPGITESEFIDCINYLTEIDYINLRRIEGKEETTLADARLEELEAKLSANGIKFLNGKISDPCVGR